MRTSGGLSNTGDCLEAANIAGESRLCVTIPVGRDLPCRSDRPRFLDEPQVYCLYFPAAALHSRSARSRSLVM